MNAPALDQSTRPRATDASEPTPTGPATVLGRRVGRRALFGGAAGLALAAGGGTAWALDRFVIEHAEVTNASSASSSIAASTAAADGVASASAYTSSTATIDITKHTSGSGSDTITWFVADVKVSDATIVRSAFAKDTFGQNIIEVPSVMASRVGSVLAINGDYYGFRDTGIVIRNGAIYRDKGARQGLAFYTDGTAKLYDETATSAAALVKAGVWNTLSFGPGLVTGGKAIAGIDALEVDTNFGNHSIQGQQPRTGVGLLGTNHLAFVVVDGRSSGYSRGMTMPEFAQLFVDLGAQTAYNLDGGGSSAMVFNGALVNNPLGRGQERGTSDILFVAG